MRSGRAIGTAVAGFGSVLASRNLRRLEMAYVGAIAADWAFTVGLGVFAYEKGGATAVGVVGLARMVPAALGTPLVSAVADRHEREHVLIAVIAIAAAAMGVAAATFYFDWSVAAVFVAAGVQGVASTVVRPTITALLPSIVSTPEQLIAANGVSATVEGLGTLTGPLVAGVLLAVANAGAVFVVAAAVSVATALLVTTIRVEGRLHTDDLEVTSDVLAGVKILLHQSRPRRLVALFGAQAFVRGAVTVLIVVISFRLLHAGGAWVGYLSAALGAGGLVGGAAALPLVGRRLAAPFGLGLVLWGVPLMLLAAAPVRASALVLLALVGVGNAIEDVAGFTLLQRLVGDAVRARVFGALFGIVMAGVGVGSIVAPGLVALLGPRGALLLTGAMLPALVALSWRRLVAIDATAAAPQRELALLEGVPLFAPLSVAAKESVAAGLVEVTAAPGTEIVRQGAAGDRFYIIGRGQADVTTDGRLLAVRGPGEYFGEIALLRGSPRMATVTARDEMELYSLDRATFLTAVTGHPVSLEVGERVVRERLATVELPAPPDGAS
jgi:MFS family permease